MNEGRARGHIRELDHLMCGFRDLEAATDTFQRMGFTVGERTDRPARGIAQRRILLTPWHDGAANYLELLQFIADPDSVMPIVAKFCAGSDTGAEGIGALIMHTPDAEAAHAHFTRLDTEQPGRGWRPDPLVVADYDSPAQDGTVLRQSFTNCILPELAPPFWVSLCQIRGFDYYLHPSGRSHANTARSLTAVLGVADDPRAAGRDMQALWGGRFHALDDSSVDVGPGQARLLIHTAQSLARAYPEIDTTSPRKAPCLAGVRITVTDMTKAAQCLEQGGIPYAVRGDGLTVAPADAHGLLIRFKPHHR